MLKLLLFLPCFLFAEIPQKLFHDCSNSDYKACSSIGYSLMDIYSPNYDPLTAVGYLESACLGGVSRSCSMMYNYYSKKGDTQRSLAYLKRACDLKDSSSCMIYNRERYK